MLFELLDVEVIEMRILPLFFIDFDLKFLSNSLLSPLLHEAILFPLSTDHVHSCSPSNVPDTEFPVLSFDAS